MVIIFNVAFYELGTIVLHTVIDGIPFPYCTVRFHRHRSFIFHSFCTLSHFLCMRWAFESFVLYKQIGFLFVLTYSMCFVMISMKKKMVSLLDQTKWLPNEIDQCPSIEFSISTSTCLQYNIFKYSHCDTLFADPLAILMRITHTKQQIKWNWCSLIQVDDYCSYFAFAIRSTYSTHKNLDLESSEWLISIYIHDYGSFEGVLHQ